MEPKFQSSFIPKGPLATPGFTPAAKTKPSGLFSLFCLFVFVLSLIGSVGIFGYNWYLSSKITKMGNDLQDARAAFEPETIKELTRLDARLVGTRDLLAQHTVLTPLFEFIESSTLKSVRFSSLEYSASTNAANGVTLSMKGQAHGYASVALQADIFNKSKYIKNPLFSDLTLDDKGNVTFAFKGGLDPNLVSFKKYLDDANGVSAQLDAALAPDLTTQVTGASSTPLNVGTASTTKSTKIQATSTATSTPRR
jgi:hypothetical protein